MDLSTGRTITDAKHQFQNVNTRFLALDKSHRAIQLSISTGRRLCERKGLLPGYLGPDWDKVYLERAICGQAKKARRAANIILGLNRFVGNLTVWDSRTLYMARVDPYLTADCEICLDMDAKSLKLLESVQCMFLRRMLGPGARPMKAVLFSETGIWPIKYRRVYLALSYLCYLLGLKTEDEKPQRPAWNGLQKSLNLARARKISWINDLCIILSRL
ncbi:hypothetical protein C8R44DRAFT_616448, partial [Mycena epipterygia]